MSFRCSGAPVDLRGDTAVETIVVYLFVGCLTSQQQASVSQGRICSDKFTFCHTEIEVADQTFYLTQSQYTDTGPTSPSADPITPGAWQGSHWSGNFEVTGMTRPRKKSRRKRNSNPGSSALEVDALPLCQRGGRVNEGNFESGQNKTKACSYALEDRECNTLFVTLDTSCKLDFKMASVL